ncbi:hypothetical protein CROQUDRAFT_91250 [Cronartium quercuum f. sp. fusiforme G11]|uniref:Uncharacterized protein n=1 Tax=Cronartium quercuum f. sp. fusiforme G11 TaxID=708437 RepID=A0A9P6NIF0_9BASI|nr:hypothetical protein CROQUDRAFT_91250 [Cronartium quercuum f. sp. fusiforme G11]
MCINIEPSTPALSSSSSSPNSSRSSSPPLIKSIKKIKSLDLNSYFSDIEEGHHQKIKKSCKQISNSNKLSLKFNQKSKIKFVKTKSSLSKSKKKIKHQEEEFSSDIEDSDSEDQEWVKEQWKLLCERQSKREKEVRQMILSRNILEPSDLKVWLDSSDTCDLPTPSLGVRLRLDEDLAARINSNTFNRS